ncbi:MAG: hypothetical protein KBS41_05380, partial [Oscillospiraceae bacterium]|nr:hypothetical protein [Candidatus Equicaccousia limihippi]
DIIGTVLIVIGVMALAFAERRIAQKENIATDRKYKIGAAALLFPLLYCVFDTLGTTIDGLILTGETGMNLSEIDVLILYGLTFFAAGIAAYIYVCIKTKKVFCPFGAKQFKTNMPAAVFEECGQIFYVYAMAKNPVLSAPMIASYCIVSVALSRIILKEKLKLSQYICVFTVIAGIVLLGISEGLSEI